MANGYPRCILDLGDVEKLLIEAAYEHNNTGAVAELYSDAAYFISKTVIPTNQQFKNLEAELAASESVIDALAAELGVTIDIGMAAVDVKSLLLEAIDGLKAELEQKIDELTLMQIGDEEA